MEKYEILSKVGEGSFGQVYKAKRRLDGEIVAFKIIRKSGKSTEELKSLRRECEIQQYLYHPNIIKMLDSFETDNEVVVITEYANKVLHEILAKAGRLSEERVQVITCDLVSALYYLHSNRILHRDLKPQNVLLDANGVAKLCDFGFARSMSSGMRVLTSIKGTPLYMAPELIEEFPYDYNVDLWSLGCIIYELITGIPPFPTSSLVQLYNLIRHETIKWPNFISSNCKNFLQGLLQKDPSQRLTWPDLLYHPFVRDRVLIMEKNSPLLIKNLPSFSEDSINPFKNQDKNHQEKGCHNAFSLETCCNICVNSKCNDANFTSSADSCNLKTKICKDVFKSECSTKHIFNPNRVYGKDLKSSTEQSSSLRISTDTSNTKSQNMEQESSIQKFSEETELELGTVDQSIENEEWIAFLQRSMEEIMNGEIESLLQDNCITIFVSPLRNPAASCRVIEYISNLLSLPFVVSIKKDDMENIQKVYLHTKVVPNLIYSIKILMIDFKKKETLNSKSSRNSESTFMLLTDKLQALESIVVLLCRLLYTREEFVKQFCNTIHIMHELQLFKSLFNLEKRKPRVVADLIGILIKVLQTKTEYSKIVDKILLEYEPCELMDLFIKLMTHRQNSLRSRICTLLSLLGKSKCTMLQQIWGRSLRNQLETLADDDDDSIKNAAENAISEIKQLSYFDQQIEID